MPQMCKHFDVFVILWRRRRGFCVTDRHTFLIMTGRGCLAVEDLNDVAFLSKKASKSLSPPSWLLTALLCFSPWTRRKDRLPLARVVRPELAAETREAKLEESFPFKCFKTVCAAVETPRGFLPEPALAEFDLDPLASLAAIFAARLPTASMSRSPSKSVLVAPALFFCIPPLVVVLAPDVAPLFARWGAEARGPWGAMIKSVVEGGLSSDARVFSAQETINYFET